MFLRRKATSQTDDELMQLYRSSQDLEWLSSLYLRYTSLVYGVCLKYLKDRDEAKDAVMQVYERLIEGLLQHEVTNFRSWLYVTARNHCLMTLRSRKNKTTEEISPIFMETQPVVHPDDDREQDLTQMEKCLETLVAEQRTCVTLFYLEEKCYKEVAVLTGFDMNQVKSYIQNGKRNLKLCMEANGQAE
ncbi:MAG: sigma-70 family RNA polymerase sigma factor [Cyclobacteriaceae bacterium]|nr:sigma-70 family RNA polymerase sigma factor [Cyclobacteriaceae bacterium]